MHQPNASEQEIFGREGPPVQPGALDGMTIMRYAHLYRDRTSGGVEQYLRLLNQGLLERHNLTVLQMHLVKDTSADVIEAENVGAGRILWVPVVASLAGSNLSDLPRRVGYVYGRMLEMHRQEGQGPFQARLSSLGNLLNHNGGHFRFKTTILSDHLRSLLVTNSVDLLAVHWLSYDTGALISRAVKTRTPFVFINHFDNARFSLPQTRKWIENAAGIGAVSGRAVPESLRSRCVNLSDAIDTEFFTPEKARPTRLAAGPVVLLPARIQAGKGHRDLIEAARILIARGSDMVLCFAGAVEVDSEAFQQELCDLISTTGLNHRILLLGEKSAEEIRDLYAASDVVVLPSYSEGLGKVLLEAQAMKKPVVAYDCGGMGEAILPNETGFIVRTGNVEALADKIGFLLENQAERHRLGERGREFVSRRFSISALIQRHEAFYLSALSGSRPNREASFATR
jgi:glycosyltransferase involved in cell wall biosynthesis